MIDVVWILVAVGFWGPSFENVSARVTAFETRHACMSKRSELIALAEDVKLPADVQCIPVANPAYGRK